MSATRDAADGSSRCLMTIHAHPDDESSKGAATLARYAAEGVRTVLVCCTGGEAGEILNPAVDTPEVRADLANVRSRELAAAAEVIGFSRVAMLGYPDSGMPEDPAELSPDCFASAPLDEAVDRLVALIRAERPQVVITYADDQQGYRHPDHLKVYDITGPALVKAGDPGHRPELGSAWTVSKLYYSIWSRERMVAVHEKMLEIGVESPFGEDWFERPSLDHRISTKVEISDFHHVRRAALLAHATQIDPDSPFWFGLPEEVARTVHPFDDFIRAQPEWDPSQPPETDLFEGI